MCILSRLQSEILLYHYLEQSLKFAFFFYYGFWLLLELADLRNESTLDLEIGKVER